jgi:hypothetical protein
MRGPIVGALLATAALVGALFADAPAARAVAAWAVALGALAAWLLLRRLGAAVPVQRVSRFDRAVLARPPRAARSREWQQLERTVVFSEQRELDLYVRLRPILRDVAAVRLSRAHGIDLDRNPEAAAEVLGPEAWDVVRPDREPPADRQAPGPGLAAVTRAIAAVERIDTG